MLIQKMHKFIVVILCLLLMHNHNAIAGQDGSMTFIGKVSDSSSDDTTSNAIVRVDGDYEIQETEPISSQYLPITCMHSQSELYFYSIVETTDECELINIYKYYDGAMHSVFENIYIGREFAAAN